MRKPARLELSNRVSQSQRKESPRGKPVRPSRNNPFAAMNKTVANVPDTAPTRRDQASRPFRRKDTQQKTKSDGEYKALKMQRSLSNVSYSRRSELKDKMMETDSFEDIPLLPSVLRGLKESVLPLMEEARPTPVQRLAIPAMLGTDNAGKKAAKHGGVQQFLLAAETGSGKTLAYLLPTADAIKRAEATETEQELRNKEQEDASVQQEEVQPTVLAEDEFPQLHTEEMSKAGKPKAIVLVPTAELVQQVTAQAKLLCHVVKFRAEGISAWDTPRSIQRKLFQGRKIDMLIATPHLLASIAETDPAILSKVTHLIIDEADSLFDRGFAPETTPIIDRSAPTLKQLIMCSATIPRSLDNFLRARYPDVRRIVTPNLHAIPRRVQLGVVDVEKDPYRGNKSLACADTIWSIGKNTQEYADDNERFAFSESEKEKIPVKRIMVFVNERETAKELTEFLISKGIDAVALARDRADPKVLATALNDFTSTVAAPDSSGKAASPAPAPARPKFTRVLPNTKVMVATDLGSRGIDTTAVRHVVLYDVPHTTIDFIHRLGRTGRMGRRGRGIVLVGKGDRRDIVKEVREGMYMGKALI